MRPASWPAGSRHMPKPAEPSVDALRLVPRRSLSRRSAHSVRWLCEKKRAISARLCVALLLLGCDAADAQQIAQAIKEGVDQLGGNADGGVALGQLEIAGLVEGEVDRDLIGDQHASSLLWDNMWDNG